jgi:hypothetical protein
VKKNILSYLAFFLLLVVSALFFTSYATFVKKNSTEKKQGNFTTVIVKEDNFQMREKKISEDSSKYSVAQTFDLDGRYKKFSNKVPECEWKPNTDNQKENFEFNCILENSQYILGFFHQKEGNFIREYWLKKNGKEIWNKKLINISEEPIPVMFKHNDSLVFSWNSREKVERTEDGKFIKPIGYEESVNINGTDVREKGNWRGAFSPAKINDKVVYFAYDDKKIYLIVDNESIPLEYLNVPHYGCCEEL